MATNLKQIRKIKIITINKYIIHMHRGTKLGNDIFMLDMQGKEVEPEESWKRMRLNDRRRRWIIIQ